MDVDVSEVEGVVVARLSGDIDLADTAQVTSRVLGAVTNESRGLVVDLSAVRYLDSAGVQMLFEFARALEAGRQSMAVVVGDASPLRRLLDITGVPQAVVVSADEAGAVEAVRSGAGRRY